MGLICTKTNSENAKLAPSGDSDTMGVRATYREVGPTCPQDCEMLEKEACYAMSGNTALHARRAPHSKEDRETIFQYLLKLPPLQKIRHHVSGDFFQDNEIDRSYLGGVLFGHLFREDLRGWTYTHGWDRFEEPINLESLTINASCDTREEASRAYRQGWPTTVVLEEDVDEIDGIKVVICPNETDGLSCAECMLCARSNRNSIVGFRKQ